MLKRVVDYESPIHIEEAMSRVVGFWGISSVGSRIREILGRVERDGISEGQIAKKGKFYWKTDMQKPEVRRRTSDEIKDIEFVAPEEIGEAALIVLDKEISMPKEDLIYQTANILGFNRITEKINSYIWKSISKYKKISKIMEIENRFMAVKEKIIVCSSCGQKLRFPNKKVTVSCPRCKFSFDNIP